MAMTIFKTYGYWWAVFKNMCMGPYLNECDAREALERKYSK